MEILVSQELQGSVGHQVSSKRFYSLSRGVNFITTKHVEVVVTVFWVIARLIVALSQNNQPYFGILITRHEFFSYLFVHQEKFYV